MAGKLLCVMVLSLAMLTACGTCKQDLEDAKTQISDLTAKNQKLVEISERAETEKSLVTKELALAKDRYNSLTAELEKLKKDFKEISLRNSDLEKQRKIMEAEVDKITKSNHDLKTELINLKKQVANNQEQQAKIESTGEPQGITRVGSTGTESGRAMDPCDSVVEYMKKSAEIIKNHKGSDRRFKLKELRAAYDSRMKGAPKPAIKASAEWVKELSKSWDKHDDNSVYRMLKLRNEALKACDRTPEQAGF